MCALFYPIPLCLSGKADVKNHLTTIIDLFMKISLLKNGPSFRNKISLFTSEYIFCVVVFLSHCRTFHNIVLFSNIKRRDLLH